MLVNVYAVMDGDKIIAEGTDEELRTHFGVPSRFSSYEANETKFQKKYRVVKHGQVEVKREIVFKSRYKPKVDKTMPYLIEHLRKYGNTVFAKRNPEYYLELLKKEGINCKARKVVDTGGKRKTYYYIFEVV